MAAAQVTPAAGLASVVTTGGTAVIAVGPLPNGGFIQNPLLAADQGLSQAEPLTVNPVGAAAVGGSGAGNGTNFVLAPGGIWQIIPGQTTTTSVNAASDGHKFSVVVY